MTTETEWRPSMPGREPGEIAACVIGVDLIRETLKRYDPPPIDPSDEEIMAAARKVIDAYFDIDGSYTDFQSTVLFRTIDVLRGAFTADQLAEMLQTEEGRRSIDERDTFALGGQPLVDETRAVNQFTRDFRQALGSEGSLMTLAVRIASIAGQVPIPIGSTQTVRSMLGEGDQDRFSHDEIIEALMHFSRRGRR